MDITHAYTGTGLFGRLSCFADERVDYLLIATDKEKARNTVLAAFISGCKMDALVVSKENPAPMLSIADALDFYKCTIIVIPAKGRRILTDSLNMVFVRP